MESHTHVKAGTLPKLVERLTYERAHPDTAFVNAFLMTYPTFISASELLDLLIARWNMPRPLSTATKEQLENFKQHLQTPIHFRVFNVLKNWVDKYPEDFRDASLKDKLVNFLDSDMKKEMERPAEQVKLTLERKLVEPPPPELFLKAKRFASGADGHSGAPSRSSSIDVFSFDVVDVAAQLTLFLHSVFCSIRPREYVHQVWEGFTSEGNTPGITALKDLTDKISRWVCFEIASRNTPKLQAAGVSYFIQVCRELHRLNNFQGLLAVVNGIANVASKTARDFWDWVSSSETDEYEIMAAMEYADESVKASGPCVPYHEMVLCGTCP